MALRGPETRSGDWPQILSCQVLLEYAIIDLSRGKGRESHMADVTSILDIMRQTMIDDGMAGSADFITEGGTMLVTLDSEWFDNTEWRWTSVRVEHVAYTTDWKIVYHIVPNSDLLVHSSTTEVENFCEDEDDIANTLLDVIKADIDDKKRFLH